jgi:hypothetical protein
MSDEKERTHCQATTKAGHRCKNQARPGLRTCYAHRKVTLGPEAEPSRRQSAQVQQLVEELDELVAELKAAIPEQVASPAEAVQPEKLVQFMKENLDKVMPGVAKDIAASFEGASKEDFLDPDTWRGVWYMLNYSLRFQAEQMKKRLMGEEDDD